VAKHAVAQAVAVEQRAELDDIIRQVFGRDAGILRPALDMCDPQQEVLMKQISDDVVALTAKYGGLLWGDPWVQAVIGIEDRFDLPKFAVQRLAKEGRAVLRARRC
jgi:hypothetical protein